MDSRRAQSRESSFWTAQHCAAQQNLRVVGSTAEQRPYLSGTESPQLDLRAPDKEAVVDSAANFGDMRVHRYGGLPLYTIGGSSDGASACASDATDSCSYGTFQTPPHCVIDQPSYITDGISSQWTASLDGETGQRGGQDLPDRCTTAANGASPAYELGHPLHTIDGRSRQGAAASTSEDSGSVYDPGHICADDTRDADVSHELGPPIMVFDGRSSRGTVACDRDACWSAQAVQDSWPDDAHDAFDGLELGQPLMVFDGRSTQGKEQPDPADGEDTDAYCGESTDLEAIVPLFVFNGRCLGHEEACRWQCEASEPSQYGSSEWEPPESFEYESSEHESYEAESSKYGRALSDAEEAAAGNPSDSAAAPSPSPTGPTPSEQQPQHQPYRVRLDSGETVLRTFEPSDSAALARDRHLLPPRPLSAAQADELQQRRKAAKVAEVAMADALLDELWGYCTFDEVLDAALATSGMEVPCTAADVGFSSSTDSAASPCQVPAMDSSSEEAPTRAASAEATEPCRPAEDVACQPATPGPASQATEELCSSSLESPAPNTEAQPVPQEAEADVEWGAPLQLPANWADLEEEALLQEEAECSPVTAGPTEFARPATSAGASSSGRHSGPALQDRDHCLLRSTGQLPWEAVHPDYEVELVDGTRAVRRFEASPALSRRRCLPPPAPPAELVAQRCRQDADMRRLQAAWRAWRSYSQQRSASLWAELMVDCSLEQSMDRAIATAPQSTAAQADAAPAYRTSPVLPAFSGSRPAAEPGAESDLQMTSISGQDSLCDSAASSPAAHTCSQAPSRGNKQPRYTFEVECSPSSAEACPVWPSADKGLPSIAIPDRALSHEFAAPGSIVPTTSQASSPGKKQSRLTCDIQYSPATAKGCPAWPCTGQDVLADSLAEKGQRKGKGKRGLPGLLLRCAVAALGFFGRPVRLSRANSFGPEE